MKSLNKKGFTLMEVLTVIIVITIIMMITLPLVDSISNRNKEELYKSYEKMMVEYAMASSKKQGTISLSELNGLDKIKNECTGFVKIDDNNYNAYIKCPKEDGSKYKTPKYDDYE